MFYFHRTTGYITLKVGKTAAFAVGGGIILLQIAQQKGYVTIDWKKIKEKAEISTEKVDTAYIKDSSKWIEKVNFSLLSLKEQIDLNPLLISDKRICQREYLFCYRIYRRFSHWFIILICLNCTYKCLVCYHFISNYVIA